MLYCLFDGCDEKRNYVIGNSKYFCKKHSHLGSKYTKIEIEKIIKKCN